MSALVYNPARGEWRRMTYEEIVAQGELRPDKNMWGQQCRSDPQVNHEPGRRHSLLCRSRWTDAFTTRHERHSAAIRGKCGRWHGVIAVGACQQHIKIPHLHPPIRPATPPPSASPQLALGRSVTPPAGANSRDHRSYNVLLICRDGGPSPHRHSMGCCVTFKVISRSMKSQLSNDILKDGTIFSHIPFPHMLAVLEIV